LDAELTGIDCTSTSRCVAAGYTTTYSAERTHAHPLVLTWDGHVWTRRQVADVQNAFFSGVDCVSATSCIAVGTTGVRSMWEKVGSGMLIERWDGSSWSKMTPPPAAFGDYVRSSNVSCAADQWCMASADVSDVISDDLVSHAVALFNRAGTWSSAVRDDVDRLEAVSCPTTTFCLGAGQYGKAFVFR
jgi:hypothetical protein